MYFNDFISLVCIVVVRLAKNLILIFFIMIHQAQNLVDCFLSGDFSNYTGAGLSGFSGTENELFINNELIIYKAKNDIIIQNGNFANYSCLVLLNLFPGVNAYHNQGKCFVNGIEWDGKKTKLSLFI